jgi:UDP:flavonoid glycosyltransferase YjiC (YdhE family)
LARLLYAWELGGGYGHVVNLWPVVAALRQRGHEVAVAAREPAQLAQSGFRVLQSPFGRMRRGRPSRSFADILADVGWDEAGELQDLATRWRALYAAERPDAVVLDYAPTARLAAALDDLPALQIGTGFYLPPLGRPLPAVTPWQEAPEAERRDAEARPLAAANAVRRAAGRPAFEALAEALAPERHLLCTWPELDHYGPREGAYVGALPARPPLAPPPARPSALVYLPVDDARLPALLDALAARGVAVLAHLRGATADDLARLARPGIAFSARPFDAVAALPRASFTVSQGAHGLAAQSLLAGRPLLMLPRHVEQSALAWRLARQGFGLVVDPRRPEPDFAAPVAKLLDGAGRQSARAFAEANAGRHSRGAAEAVVDACQFGGM